ncbi:MAG: hypothetical protein C0502_08160 [Opitutus sp.]|nr:hypothetical protein [Opitutus sp.]
MSPTFRERYCRHWAIPLEQFEPHALARALYPQARLVRGLLRLRAGYFTADCEFLRSVGDIRSRRLFPAEAADFHYVPQNRDLCRRWLRLRVSAERTRQLMEECWGDPDSAAPMEVSGRQSP